MSGAPFEGADDVALPFAVEPLDVRGRVVRLGQSIDTIISRHGYPDAVVTGALGEAAALTVLLGSSLKFQGRFQLQTKTDGPIEMIVVDFDAPDRLRATARFDQDRLNAMLANNPRTGELIGSGYLAMTIDQGTEQSRYQGVVALEGQGFEEAAHEYFRQSEQIPTRVRLAVAEHSRTVATRIAPAVSWCSFYRHRPSGCVRPTWRPGTYPRAIPLGNSAFRAKTMRGRRQRRSFTLSRITSLSTLRFRANACFIAFSTNTACVFSKARMSTRNAAVRKPASCR